MSGPGFAGSCWKVCEEMEDLFSAHFGESAGAWPSERIVPSLDLAETDNAIELRMDVPDMEAKDIDIRVNGNSVTISGEQKRRARGKGQDLSPG